MNEGKTVFSSFIDKKEEENISIKNDQIEKENLPQSSLLMSDTLEHEEDFVESLKKEEENISIKNDQIEKENLPQSSLLMSDTLEHEEDFVEPLKKDDDNKNNLDDNELFEGLDTSNIPNIPYTYMKDIGVIILGCDKDNVWHIGKRLDVLALEGSSAFDASLMLELRRIVKGKFKFISIAIDEFDKLLTKKFSTNNLDNIDIDESSFGGNLEDAFKATDLLDSEDDAPIIKLINTIIAQAVRMKASDIHCEPYENEYAIRFRIDGALRDVLKLSSSISARFSSRLKVMAKLDIAETRVPQDGRISLSLGGQEFDVRMSSLPSRFGERIVMRLLDKTNSNWQIDNIGMDKKTMDEYKSSLLSPNGIILVTGPTGSGKTTTLYAGIDFLNDRIRNILTVEDPIEYALSGIGQTQVNNKAGMSFAAGFRAILRQDPDIVMVGEIRDEETAQIAVQASLTGHLVLSTLHTNTAMSAITRLRDMGMASYLLASTITASIAQRLIRVLCDNCKQECEATDYQKEILGMGMSGENSQIIFLPQGCSMCDNTGFNGRTGVYEIVLITDELKKLIHDNASEAQLVKNYFKSKSSMMEQVKLMVLNGATSIEEAIRQVNIYG